MRRVAAAWRPAARLARREVRRRPWRTALVVTLVALPVAGATFAAIFVRTVTPTRAEQREVLLGQADDLVYDDSSADNRDTDEFAQAVAGAYPPGSRLVAFTRGDDAVTTPDGHLEDGKAVVPGLPVPLDAQLSSTSTSRTIDQDEIVVADLVVPNARAIVIVSPETAMRWGLSTYYPGTLFRNPDPLTDGQRRELADPGGCPSIVPTCRDQEIRDQLLGRPQPGLSGAYVQVTYPNRALDREWDQQTAAAAGILGFTLLVVAVALALTATESRDDRALLDAIGASPGVRRSIVAWQAGLLPGVAMLLAVPGGLVVAFAFTVGDPNRTASNFSVPWVTVGLLAVGVPVASALVAWLVTGIAARRRRDLSTLALTGD